MTFEEALTRSPIKTVRVLAAGKFRAGRNSSTVIATPLIIREFPDGTAKAYYSDEQNVQWRATLNSATYAEFKQDCRDMKLHCKPMDE
jgi:hypothetical protein